MPDEIRVRTIGVLSEVAAERAKQDAKWGAERTHPSGTGKAMSPPASYFKTECDRAARDGTITWLHILQEEVAEAAEEGDPSLLRQELVQVAAVAVAWIESLDILEDPDDA